MTTEIKYNRTAYAGATTITTTTIPAASRKHVLLNLLTTFPAELWGERTVEVRVNGQARLRLKNGMINGAEIWFNGSFWQSFAKNDVVTVVLTHSLNNAVLNLVGELTIWQPPDAQYVAV